MFSVFGQPFIKRFALCYQTIVLSCRCVLSDVGVLWPNGWTVGHIKMKLSTRTGLGPGHIVRWGPSFSFSKGHSPPTFVHICCRKMAGWIKMPLGREIGLCPSDIVLDGTQLPSPKRGQSPPIFGPCLLWSMQVGLGPGHIVIDGDQAPLPKKGTQPPILSLVFCGQMAGWIRMPRKGAQPCLVWTFSPSYRLTLLF